MSMRTFDRDHDRETSVSDENQSPSRLLNTVNTNDNHIAIVGHLAKSLYLEVRLDEFAPPQLPETESLPRITPHLLARVLSPQCAEAPPP